MESGKKVPTSVRSRDLRFQFEIDRETDGRWIAEIPEVPGAMAYGTTVEELVQLNNLANPDSLYPGEVLIIPSP